MTSGPDRGAEARAIVAEARRNPIARGATGAFGLKIIDAAAALLISLALARLLGAEDFGRYSVIIAWVSLLTVPALLGMENLTVRHVAGYAASGDTPHLRGVIGFVVSVVGAVSVTVAALAAAIGIAVGLPGIATVTFALGMAIIPLAALTRVLQAATRGLHHIVAGFIPELVVTPGLLLLLIALGWLGFVRPLDATWAIGVTVAATAVGAATAAFVLVRRLPRALAGVKARTEGRAWIATAMPLLLIGGMQMVIRQADIVLLGLIRGPREAGIYAVATRGSQLVSFLLYAVNAALAPNISRLHVAGRRDELQRIVTRSARVVLAVAGPVAAALIVFGSTFLSVFGEEFRVGSTALAILTLGQLFNAATGSVGNLLTMTGHERDAAAGFGLSGIANIGLNLALIPSLGIVGAALANAGSLMIWNILLVVAVRRRLGIHATALGQIGGPGGGARP